MAILIDGHNLIGKMPDLKLDDPDDEEKLLVRLRAYRARTGKRLVIYFDPGVSYQSPMRLSKGGVTVRQAGAGQQADDLIMHHIRRHHNPRDLTVVTSDRAIQRVAQQHDARVIDSATFAAEIGRLFKTGDRSDDRPLTKEEIQEWLTVFGQPDEL